MTSYKSIRSSDAWMTLTSPGGVSWPEKRRQLQMLLRQLASFINRRKKDSFSNFKPFSLTNFYSIFQRILLWMFGPIRLNIDNEMSFSSIKYQRLSLASQIAEAAVENESPFATPPLLSVSFYVLVFTFTTSEILKATWTRYFYTSILYFL